MNLLSDLPFPPQGILDDFLWGLFGVLSAAALVLTVIVQWKKAFGRMPSLSEIISGLATIKNIEEVTEKIKDLSITVSGFASKSDIEKAKMDRDDIRKEVHTRTRGIEEQIGAIRHELRTDYQAIKSAAEVRQEEFAEKLGVVRSEIATLRERTETTNRKVDSIDNKLDNIWRNVAARLER